MVDADGDGLISYSEYMFFNTLLASRLIEWNEKGSILMDHTSSRTSI